MKRLYKFLLAIVLSVLAIAGVCGSVGTDVKASSNTHVVTFDYNTSRVLQYMPETSTIRNSLVNYVITVEDGRYARETKIPHQSVFAYYTYEWTYNGVVVDLDNFAITDDVVFSARWTPRTYKVYFEFGSDEIKETITNREDTLEFTVESGRIDFYIPSRPHYDFDGWYDNSSPVEYMYLPARSIGDKVLKARFTPKQYTINYNTDADIKDNNRSYNVEDVSLPLFNPTKYGHIFKGWYSDKDFTNRIYYIDCSKGGNLNVYPLWEKQTYEVTYILPNGLSETVMVDYGDTAALPDINKSIFEVVKTDISRKNITENRTIRVELVNIWYVYLIALVLVIGIIALVIVLKKRRENTHNKLRYVYQSNVRNGKRKR